VIPEYIVISPSRHVLELPTEAAFCPGKRKGSTVVGAGWDDGTSELPQLAKAFVVVQRRTVIDSGKPNELGESH